MYRLLIVDDEPVIVEGLATMLGGSDLPLKEIKLAYSAKEALAYFEDSPFDIILADIRMPQLDGLQMVERIKSKTTECKIIFLTGYSDFEFARQAVKFGASDYLLKPIDDEAVISSIRKVIGVLDKEYENMLALEKAKLQLTKALHSQKVEFFRQLSNRTLKPDPMTLRRNFQHFDIPFDEKKQVTSSILFRIDEWDDHFDPEDEPLLQFAVDNILNEMLQETCHLESFQVEKGLTAIVLQAKTESVSENIQSIMQQKLEGAQDTIYRVLGAVVSFEMLQRSVAWNEWPEQLNSLTANMRLHLGKGMLIVHNSEASSLDAPVMSELIQNIIDNINSRDIESFERNFDLAALDMQGASQGAVNAISSTFMTISAHILDQARKYNLSNIFNTEDIEKMTNLYRHKNLQEMKTFMMEMLNKLVSMMESYRRNPAEAVINQVKAYIGNHLMEELSLNVLARKVYMNSSYLSRIFSQHTQEQLSVYITRTKMEYARSLLMNSDFKIYEISQKVGFENPNYFAKVFRKAFGISPQDYRNMNNMQSK